ncbi:MAG: BamA/TamA family outer membrane protein [Salinivirgaceae bacterium]|nr:BamA/TamA family outer membrane protein [Salinivirgaceae bacterium]
MHKISKNSFFILTASLLILASCRTTRFVPDNQYLLEKVIIKCDNRQINTDELMGFVQQKSNKKVAYFLRLHLHVYNIFSNEKDKGFINWIGKTVGEEPVIYDRFLTQKSITQLKIHLANRGFYDAEIKDSIVFGDRSVTVYYIIKSNEAYLINENKYKISNPIIDSLIMSDTANSVIKRNDLFDIKLFDTERQRITRFMKERGYYFFSPSAINYIADTTVFPNRVNVTTKIGYKGTKNNIEENTMVTRPCYIRDIIIYPSFDPKRAIIEGEEYSNKFDTLQIEDYTFLMHSDQIIKTDVILKALSISENDKYDIRKVEETHKYLNSIGFFKLINIRFDQPKNLSDTAHSVNCIMQLTPFTIQSYTVELEASNSGNNYETAINLAYQHRNIFHGAEMLNLKIKGASQIVTEGVSAETENKYRFNSFEYGAEASIDFPKFFMPFVKSYFYKKHHPKTSTGAGYNYQNQPNYTRTILKGNFGYFWNSSKNFRHVVNPIELNSVRFPLMDSSYLANNLYRQKDFDNFFISSAWYSLIFSNQELRSARDYIYFKYNIEFAGNLLTAFYKLTNQTMVDGSYAIDPQTKIAQFAKTDVDFRYYSILNRSNKLVYRVFIGAGIPYGNTQNMPFVKQYSAGGAADIRAWQVGRLGPGTFVDTTLYPNQTANFKLIGNLEYRFPLFWMIEGALFVDVGNIWSINRKEQREATIFKFNRFYKELAVGSGAGIRIDLDFLLVRIDGALKVRNPSPKENSGWIPFNEKYTWNDFQLHIGIGYPF